MERKPDIRSQNNEKASAPTREEIAAYLEQGRLPDFARATVEKDLTAENANNHYNWVIVRDGKKYLMRIARPQEEKTADIALEYEILKYLDGRGITPRTYAMDAEHFAYPFLIEDFVEGRTLAEQFGLEEAKAVARTLGKLHGTPPPPGIRLADRSSAHRWEKLQERFETATALPLVREYAAPLLPLLSRLQNFFDGAAKEADSKPQVFLHGDLYTGNVVITPEGKAMLIDMQYPALGDPTADFGNLFVGRTERNLYDRYKAEFLAEYEKSYGLYPDLTRLFDIRMLERDITSLFSELRDAAKAPQNEAELRKYFENKGFAERITRVEQELKTLEQ